MIEAQIALDAKLAGIRELEGHLCHAHIQLAERSLAQMRLHFRAESEKQENDLIRDAADEKNKAQSSDDPLERFRARRTAELLELEAQVLKIEQALATNPSPSFEEQQTLADHADKDFAQIKELLDDGEVSRLDAIRLNNEFRRIAPERERLVRNEMALVEARLQFFEAALTNVEIELFQDSLHDRLERDLLKERVSAERWAAGENPPDRARAKTPRDPRPPPEGPRETRRTSIPNPSADRSPPLDPRPGIRLHPHPDLLGPRPGPHRRRHVLAGGPRVQLSAQGTPQAGGRKR